MNDVIKNFNIFDILERLVPGACLIYLLRYFGIALLPIPNETDNMYLLYLNAVSITENIGFVIVFGYVLGIAIEQMGEGLIGKIIRKYAYDDSIAKNPDETSSGKNLEADLLKIFQNVFLQVTVRNLMAPYSIEKMTEEEIDLYIETVQKNNMANELMIKMGLNYLEQEKLNAKEERMLVVARMCRSLGFVSLMVCFIQPVIISSLLICKYSFIMNCPKNNMVTSYLGSIVLCLVMEAVVYYLFAYVVGGLKNGRMIRKCVLSIILFFVLVGVALYFNEIRIIISINVICVFFVLSYFFIKQKLLYDKYRRNIVNRSLFMNRKDFMKRYSGHE